MYDTMEWLVEDILHTGADVREQADGVANEVGREEDTVELAEHLLAVVVYNTRLEVGHRQAHVFDSERIHPEGCVVDVADSHRERVEYDGEWVIRADPAEDQSDNRKNKAGGGAYFSSALTRSVRINDTESCMGWSSRTSK